MAAEAEAYHRPQAEALASAGADLLLGSTMSRDTERSRVGPGQTEGDVRAKIVNPYESAARHRPCGAGGRGWIISGRGRQVDMRRYVDVIASGRHVLTDGATGTRLRLETPLTLDPVLDVSALAMAGRGDALRAVAGEYAAIAAALGLPIEIDAVTYWASPDRLAAAGRPDDLEAINRACVEALVPIKAIGEVFIAGVVGPRADGYRPRDAMTAAEAEAYHRPQAEALASAGADLLLGSTMSTATESVGVARALAATGSSYVMAFVMTSQGQLPDGETIAGVIALIDESVDPRPVHYLLSCTHPSTASDGLRRLSDQGHDLSDRLVGIKANGAMADPSTLEAARAPISDPPMEWSRDVAALRVDFGLRVLGGCCGTDGRHILALGIDLQES
jgi:S-methylmethionine-dependent homocysteine/selenocysteine methylase